MAQQSGGSAKDKSNGGGASPAADVKLPDPVEMSRAMSRIAEQSQKLVSEFLSRQSQAPQFGMADPLNIGQAFLDMTAKLITNPMQLVEAQINLWQDYMTLWQNATKRMLGEPAQPVVTPTPEDRRFKDAAWDESYVFDFIKQSYLLTARWMQRTVKQVEGLDDKTAKKVDFYTRQFVDAMAPSNFALTNPEVIRTTLETGGENLVKGLGNLIGDMERGDGRLMIRMTDDAAFKVGENIAITPGKVIARTRLMELIQYSPATKTVHPDPVLIVPAWIMKYYILDLSPNNSLVKYLVDQGFTVFMISWKNPDETYHDCGMDDYRRLGIMEALRAISQVLPERKAHALGYCLGGTLLTIAAAAMARDGDDRIKTLTLLAAQTDFSQPGELNLFVGDSTLAYLEDMMQEIGYLDGDQMAGTFQLLRSNDLIWSRMTRDYLMGERQQIFDLMAWNADATRMPARMHSEYLRKIFFNNELAQGRYLVDGRAIALRDIRAPMFVVGTESDHVAPWRSVYQINVISDTDVTFLLTSGGHNAGIISEPGRKNRAYRVATAKHDDPYIDPEIWLQQNKPAQGSWWLEWVEWLRAGSNEFAAPPPLGAPEAGYIPICDAPGTYVFE